MIIYLVRPPHVEARIMHRCTTCKAKRRAIVLLYEYYSPRVICGGCGYTFSDCGRVAESAESRNLRRQWVRETWRELQPVKEAIKAFDGILEQT